jgi:hypothetical protein
VRLREGAPVRFIIDFGTAYGVEDNFVTAATAAAAWQVANNLLASGQKITSIRDPAGHRLRIEELRDLAQPEI